jgi:hypothetical protein|tara:strand:+ start:167 stop:379 length:213 start_codon:yes stop_codon:yes gene_type:complete
MSIFIDLQSKIWKIVFLYMVFLGIVACGVKSAPKGFENQVIIDNSETPKNITKPSSIQGFPLEYPNRPSY